MSVSVSFTLGSPTKTLNELRSMHFRAYAQHRKSVAFEVAALLAGKRPSSPFARANVRIERYSSSTPDMDGLYGGLKPLLDVLQPFSAKSAKRAWDHRKRFTRLFDP